MGYFKDEWYTVGLWPGAGYSLETANILSDTDDAYHLYCTAVAEYGIGFRVDFDDVEAYRQEIAEERNISIDRAEELDDMHVWLDPPGCYILWENARIWKSTPDEIKRIGPVYLEYVDDTLDHYVIKTYDDLGEFVRDLHNFRKDTYIVNFCIRDDESRRWEGTPDEIVESLDLKKILPGKQVSNSVKAIKTAKPKAASKRPSKKAPAKPKAVKKTTPKKRK